MDFKELYETCRRYVTRDNHEIIEDSYGNHIESFLILDDLALCFCFNDKDELLNCWYC